MGGHLCKERWASLKLFNLEKTLMGRALVTAVNSRDEQEEQYRGIGGRVHPLNWQR